MSATLAVRHNLQDYAGWRKVYKELESDGPAAASDPDQHPPDLPETTMVNPARIPASDPGSIEPQRLPGGQDLRDVAVQLRFMLNSGTSFAIATVVGARGTALRRPGTVVVISQSGQTIGFNPAGPLDGAVRELAAEALTTGQDRLERLEIDHEAASYIGLSGGVSLDVHATRVRAGDPVFSSALRYLGNGTATVLAIGTCGVSGHAVISADRVAGGLSWPELPAQVIDDARSMLGSRRAVCRTYRLGGETGSARVQVWMQSHPGG
jgi:xanthine dehydrogenase accessory factor